MFARHYPRHCSSSRIRPESRSGRRSFVSLSPPILPSARDSSIPIRDLWIIVRLIPPPPLPPKRESIAEDEDSIRFDDVSTTTTTSSSSSSSRTDLLISRRQCILCSRMRNRNGIKDNRSEKIIYQTFILNFQREKMPYFEKYTRYLDIVAYY